MNSRPLAKLTHRRRALLALPLIALLGACAADVPGLDPLPNQIRFPLGMRVLPGDQKMLVVSSNFDLQFNSATVVVVDTRTNAIEPRHTVRVNSFSGDIALRSDGKRAYVVSREEGRLNIIDVDPSAERMLKCTSAPPAAGTVPRCTEPYVVTTPINPFAMQLIEAGSQPVGCTGTRETLPETLFVTHINTATNPGALPTGVITAFEPTGENSVPYLFKRSFALSGGPAAIGRHPVTGTLYVTSRFDASIALLRYAADTFSNLSSFTVTTARRGTDMRGVAFHPDGHRAFVAYRATNTSFGTSNPLLLALDTTCGSNGRERNTLVGVVDLCADPGNVEFVRQPGQPDRLYVPCSGSRQIYVFDAELLALETAIDVGDGAYLMTLTSGVRTGVGLKRAYVSNFREDSVSVIDLDPQSPNFQREIGRIRENPRVLP